MDKKIQEDIPATQASERLMHGSPPGAQNGSRMLAASPNRMRNVGSNEPSNESKHHHGRRSHHNLLSDPCTQTSSGGTHTHELAAAHECRDPMEWPKTLKPSHHAKHYTRTKQPSQIQHDNKKSKAAGAATLPEGLLRI